MVQSNVLKGIDANGDLIPVKIDLLGRLETTVFGSSGVVTNFTGESLALAAQTVATFSTPDIAAPQDLIQVRVGGTDSFKYSVFAVDNAIETLIAGPFYSFFGDEDSWEPKEGAVQVTGGTAGLDAFRIKVTNLAKNKAADFSVFLSHRAA